MPGLWLWFENSGPARSGGTLTKRVGPLKLEGVTTHEHREWLPILENSQDMEALAARARVLMRGNPTLHGFLIRRHGLYTWGRDLDAAARHVEILEFLLESVGRRQML